MKRRTKYKKKSLSLKGVVWIAGLVEELNGSELSSWEQEFVSSINSLISKYGSEIRLTGKQISLLKKLEYKHERNN